MLDSYDSHLILRTTELVLTLSTRNTFGLRASDIVLCQIFLNERPSIFPEGLQASLFILKEINSESRDTYYVYFQNTCLYQSLLSRYGKNTNSLLVMGDLGLDFRGKSIESTLYFTVLKEKFNKKLASLI